MRDVGYLLWDFDGTLGYRQPMWSGTLREVLRRELPELDCEESEFRPYLKTGYPWHQPDLPHAHIARALRSGGKLLHLSLRGPSNRSGSP